MGAKWVEAVIAVQEKGVENAGVSNSKLIAVSAYQIRAEWHFEWVSHKEPDQGPAHGGMRNIRAVARHFARFATGLAAPCSTAAESAHAPAALPE
ncbi:MAG: hypothetical protein KA775_13270, partial [Ottowia sp.]|nr:hypothetical protein [Ottowia sp.]